MFNRNDVASGAGSLSSNPSSVLSFYRRVRASNSDSPLANIDKKLVWKREGFSLGVNLLLLSAFRRLTRPGRAGVRGA